MGLLCDIAVKELHKLFKSVSYSCLTLLTCMNHRSFRMFENVTFLEAVLMPLVFFLNFFIFHRTSPFVHIKEEPPSPTYSPEVEEVCPVEVEVGALSGVPVDTPLSPTTFINSILQESEPITAPSPPPSDQKCLSVACLDKWVLPTHAHSIRTNKATASLLILSSVFPYWVTLFP